MLYTTISNYLLTQENLGSLNSVIYIKVFVNHKPKINNSRFRQVCRYNILTLDLFGYKKNDQEYIFCLRYSKCCRVTPDLNMSLSSSHSRTPSISRLLPFIMRKYRSNLYTCMLYSHFKVISPHFQMINCSTKIKLR